MRIKSVKVKSHLEKSIKADVLWKQNLIKSKLYSKSKLFKKNWNKKCYIVFQKVEKLSSKVCFDFISQFCQAFFRTFYAFFVYPQVIILFLCKLLINYGFTWSRYRYTFCLKFSQYFIYLEKFLWNI